jgi:hypothetical protein
MRQIHLWFRQEYFALPVVRYSAEEGRGIAGRLLVYKHDPPDSAQSDLRLRPNRQPRDD